jgi:glutamate/tyrosine decarboxylase-like PLP-dependent enzyme
MTVTFQFQHPIQRGDQMMRPNLLAMTTVGSIALVVASVVAEAMGARHLAVALIVCGSTMATLAGMAAMKDAVRSHRR